MLQSVALDTTKPHSRVRPKRSRRAADRAITIEPCRQTLRNESLTIRLADTDGQRSAASMLLSRMYAWRGYGGKHVMDASPNSVTFTATSGECVVGTLTLNVDAGTGLAADNTFAEELAPFRAVAGAKLCELTKFAFDWAGPSHRHLAALFHLVFIYGSRQFACSDLFIEVNPRHRRYYETMLGFSRVGEVRINASVNAPSQLMWLNVGAIRQMIDKRTKSSAGARRSLYQYFFSPDEEDGLFGRLTGAPPQALAPNAGVHHQSKPAYSAKRLLSFMIGAKLKGTSAAQ